MDVVGYAEAAAGLLNADLGDADALIDFLEGREWLHRQIVDKDVPALRRFQAQLRPVFEAGENGDPHGTVNGLNALMEKHPITPRIFEHAPGKLQLHVANRSEEHTSELQSLMRISYAVFCLKKNKTST